MSRCLRLLTATFLYILPLTVLAQTTPAEANALLDAEQIQYRGYLQGFNSEEGIRIRIREFAYHTTDSLQAAFHEMKKESPAEEVLAINSLRYFLQTLRSSLKQNQYDIYDVPEILEKFPVIADAVIQHKPLRDIMGGFGARRTQLLADAFRQFTEGKRLQQLADIRRVAVGVDNIIPFLERRTDFPYTDTALVYVGELAPMNIVNYITYNNTRITDIIRQHKNPVISQLVTLSGNRNAGELAHFAKEMSDGRYTKEELLYLRSSDVNGYYQLLVNSIQENRRIRLAGGPPGMQAALRNALHEKAMAFYIRQINDLHESSGQARFASIQPLRAIDLYYLLTTGEDELYTSSFLGIYKRMMEQLPAGRSDSLMEWVQYDQFRKFIRTCSHYNVLFDFLNNMPESERQSLLSKFIAGIEADVSIGMEEAMDVADAFISLTNDTVTNTMVGQLLDENLQRCRNAEHFFGIRMYNILHQVYEVANDTSARKKLFGKLGNYELLPVESIRDQNEVIHQLVIFYGDADGKASFASFMSLFRDTMRWEVVKHSQWMEICSRNTIQPIRIFANLPLDHEFRLDELAQQALLQYLSGSGIKPGIIIHRGHSYHLPTTLNYLQPYTRLAILGSCGGYKNLLTVVAKSPGAQIVATKQIGSKLINDPMIQELNTQLSQQQDIYWPELWNRLGEQFGKSESTRNLFSEYVPPYRNLSLFVIRLYNSDAGSL